MGEHTGLECIGRDALSVLLKSLRDELDCYVEGHGEVKEALLLGLIAHEHVLLEGEPGCAKTWMAEILAGAAGLRYEFFQMHRDIRLSDLLGETVLQRSWLQDGVEVVRQGVLPGGLLTGELCVLDDITRAPGEALNVSLRILNERKYQSKALPLLMVIATSNPSGGDYCNEPLDAANLDRFTVQLRLRGAIVRRQWQQARSIMDRWNGESPRLLRDNAHKKLVTMGDVLRRARAKVEQVQLPEPVRCAYMQVLQLLCQSCLPEESLLTDRTMLKKAPLMIKALALLRGRQQAELQDLHVLRYLLSFRIPEKLYQQLEQLIQGVIQLHLPKASLTDSSQQAHQEAASQDSPQQGHEAEAPAATNGEEDIAQQISEMLGEQALQALRKKAVMQQAASSDQQRSVLANDQLQTVHNMELLLETLRGRLERSSTQQENNPAGSPRSYQRMRHFEELLDSDLVETFLWMEHPQPNLPRVYRRSRKHKGGKVVIIRDISQSMEGRYARWTSSIITQLVELARKKRMRIGYIEFNHASHKHQHNGRFFSRDYQQLITRAANVTCCGVTNYQHPLQEALAALKTLEHETASNKHILFLTDGEPTQGDWLVRAERKLAQALGVCIHTLFIGAAECPEILDILSQETSGSQFQAIPAEDGALRISARNPSA